MVGLLRLILLLVDGLAREVEQACYCYSWVTVGLVL